VHGNISLRTILVGYSGDVKIAGYRPGCHAPADADIQSARDLKPIANILYDLPFQMFPKELAHLVPRLLDEAISPVEAMAAAKAFLRSHVPSADDRRKVASWLDAIFPGQRASDIQEHEQLLAQGIELCARASIEQEGALQIPAIDDDIGEHKIPMGPIESGTGRVPSSSLFRRPLFKGIATGMVGSILLAGGIALLMSNRGHHAVPLAQAPAAAPTALPIEAGVAEQPVPAPPDADLPVPEEVTAPVDVPVSPPQPRPGVRAEHSAKRMPEKSSTRQLLRAADAAFDGGDRIKAVKLAAQAVDTGGGVRAHLALGRYYRSMHRYGDALVHYRAVLDMEPGNRLAQTGIEVIEKQLAPSP
jgi:hypothetical protein